VTPIDRSPTFRPHRKANPQPPDYQHQPLDHQLLALLKETFVATKTERKQLRYHYNCRFLIISRYRALSGRRHEITTTTTASGEL
jgi:hypothetical protein